MNAHETHEPNISRDIKHHLDGARVLGLPKPSAVRLSPNDYAAARSYLVGTIRTMRDKTMADGQYSMVYR